MTGTKWISVGLNRKRMKNRLNFRKFLMITMSLHFRLLIKYQNKLQKIQSLLSLPIKQIKPQLLLNQSLKMDLEVRLWTQ